MMLLPWGRVRPGFAIAALALVGLALLAMPASPAQAAGVVNVCDEAHLKAALSGGGTVTFTCSGTITLTDTITIATDTVIDGSGQSVTLSGGNAVRLFLVNSRVTFSLHGLTLIRGSAPDSGGSIRGGPSSQLIISHTSFFDNTAPEGGGAIYHPGGPLTITDSIFSRNIARFGGAVYAGVAVTVTGSSFSDNGNDFTDGGALYVGGGWLGATGRSFSDNGTASTDGGAIPSGGSSVDVISTSFDGNSGYQGGAILIDWVRATVMDSVFFNNRAFVAGGALHFLRGSVVRVDASTIHENRASSSACLGGGGIYNQGSLTLTNSTLWKNVSQCGGGGIANTLGGTATVLNSTIADNGAAIGGGVYNSGDTVTLKNTLVANSSARENCYPTIVDGGGNLSYPDHTCGGINLNPLLGALADNGGPTQTMALGDGSAAIDAGMTAGCQDAQINHRDQRGNPRFVDGDGDTLAWCDIGAYEAESLAGYPQWEGGQGFTCDVTPDGAIQCFGRSKEGQLAAPSGAYRQVSAGGVHACAIRAGDSKVTCWGSNSIPVKSCVSEICSTIYIDTGQARPPDGAFVQVTAGGYHSCGLKFDGSVDCWGSNINENQKSIGQAQDQAGPFSQMSAGMWHNCAVRQADGIVECWGDTSDGKAMPPAGVAFTQVTAGANHTCGLKADGFVECWGGNTWGQAPKTRYGPYKEVRAGDLFTCGLLRNGILDCWGYNFYGQTKEPADALRTFGLGDAHGCATIAENDEWICWGRNDQDQANPPLPGAPPTPFAFAGFYPPLAPDTGGVPALNVVKAGNSVPLKFSLGGDYGLDVVDVGSPASGSLDCATLDPGDDLQTTAAAGGTALTYDPASGQYTYVWKTDRTWAGTCRYLSLQLVDGTEHRAAFRFK